MSYKRIALASLCLNLVIVILLYHELESNVFGRFTVSWTDSQNALELQVTIVLLEFEVFDNNLSTTLLNICQIFSTINILVVSEKIIYPPVRFKNVYKYCTVRFVTSQPSPEKDYNSTRPEVLIDTKYVLFVPDGVVFDRNVHDGLTNLVAQHDGNHISVISLDHNVPSYCQKIVIQRKLWTLKYQRHSGQECDAFYGEVALLIPKDVLMSFNDPFRRPHPQAIYLQAKVKNFKLKLLSSNLIGVVTASSKERSEKIQAYYNYRLDNLYHDYGYKKVTDATNQTSWHGCSKRTARCFGSVYENMPDFLYEGRWTPPCCLKNLRETAAHVFQVLESYNIRYWLEGGSLLGAIRNGDIIPWDYDVDIGVYQEDLIKLSIFMASTDNAIVDERGFVWEKAIEGDFYRVQFSKTNRLHVDIFPFYSRNGTMTKNTWFESHPQDCEFPEHFLQPLERYSFAAANPFGPNNARKFLELKFGVGAIEHPQYPSPELLDFNAHIS